MPAAAGIPAQKAYITAVAVKKLVVEPWVWSCGPAVRRALQERTFVLLGSPWGLVPCVGDQDFLL